MKPMNKSLLILLVLAPLMLAGCGDDDDQVIRVTYNAIDLGLSVKWADKNIGAAEDSGYGKLIAWADSTGLHNTQDKIEISFRPQESGELTICEWHSAYYGGVNPLMNISGTDYDPARYIWNTNWCLPTLAQWQELISNCTWSKEEKNGHNLVRATGPNGNSIVFPLAGYSTAGSVEGANGLGFFWTANLLPKAQQGNYGYQSNTACCAWAVMFNFSEPSAKPELIPMLRCYTMSVRPVAAK